MSLTPELFVLRRTELRRALGRLPPFDLVALLTVSLLADPTTGSLTASWDAFAGEVGLTPALLQPVIERLHRLGFLVGRVDAPDGFHVHVDGLLQIPPSVPLNLPLETRL